MVVRRRADHRAVTPWFRRRPLFAMAVTIALYVVVFAARLAVHGTADAVSLLFVLPIALAGFVFGARGGVVAGALALVLIGVWTVVDGAHLSLFGWSIRGAAMLLLGFLVGEAVDGLCTAALAERRLAAAQLREREAAEINDAIVQYLVAGKWAVEAGDVTRSIEVLTAGIETAQALVRNLLADHDDARTVQLVRPPLDPDRSARA